MNLNILVCFLFACLAINYSYGLEASLTANLWSSYKKQHGKEYHSKEAEQYRFKQFQKNLDLIEQHNLEYAAGLQSYTLGINHYADWSFDEFRSKLLGYRADLNRTKSDLKFKPMLKSVALPTEIDWRKHGLVTDVKNQGDCGSCYTFSATGALEGAYAKATGELVSLSEQQLVDCSTKYGNNGCDGGLMDNVFQYVIENGGITTEDVYPYEGVQGDCKFETDTAAVTCKSFVDIPSQDEDALKEAVATVGPVSVAIDATQEKFMLYKEGVFIDNTCGNTDDKLNHGVLVVGYGTQTSHSPRTGKTNRADYWIVKNSWGPTWGESGYIRMARNKKNMCGVATTASYPVVK